MCQIKLPLLGQMSSSKWSIPLVKTIYLSLFLAKSELVKPFKVTISLFILNTRLKFDVPFRYLKSNFKAFQCFSLGFTHKYTKYANAKSKIRVGTYHQVHNKSNHINIRNSWHSIKFLITFGTEFRWKLKMISKKARSHVCSQAY